MKKTEKAASQSGLRKNHVAENALRESEEKFRLIAEKTADTITLLDMELNITYISPSIQKLRGYPVEEAMAHRMDQIFTPASLIRMQKIFTEQMALESNAMADPNRSVTLELEELHKDGSVICVEIAVSFIRDNTLKPTGILTVTRDITMRKISEQRISQLASIVESSDDAIFSKSLDGVITSWNKGAENIYGYKEQEIIGKSVSILILPEMQGEMSLILEKISAGQHIDHLETLRRRKDGRQINVSLTISPIIDINGRIIGASTIGYDITERIRAEKALQKANEELKRILKFNEALLSAIPTPVFYKDKEGRYIGCNRAFSEIMGVTPEQIKGKTVYELWPGEHARTYHNKDLELLENPSRQIYEFKVHDKDGIERPVIYSKDIFYDEKDKAVGIVGAFMDITERKRVEDELQKSNDLLRAIIEAAPTAIYDLDLEGRVKTVWNPAAEKMLGWKAWEVIGKSLSTVDTEKQEEFRHYREQIRNGMTLNGIELQRHKKDGSPIDYCLFASPLYDSKGSVNGNVAVLMDITERKLAEREIAHMNRSLRMLSNSNQVLIHATDESTLFHNICRNIVEVGGYPMVWVGLIEHDENKSIRRVAQLGKDFAYLEKTKISWDEKSANQCPCSIAARSGHPYIFHDSQSDSFIKPWQDAALQSGYKSIIGLPLLYEGQILGTIGIYSGESVAFSDQEVEILQELAGDIAFGIAALRSRDKKKHAEEALRISEEKYRILFEDNPTMYFTVTQESLIQSVNRFGCSQLGYSQDELVGKLLIDLVVQEDKGILKDHLLQCIHNPNHAHTWEERIVHKNGKTIWIRVTARAILASEGSPLMLIVSEEITEYKQSQALQVAIYLISEAAQTVSNLIELYRSIHAIIGELMPARNFFIALYNAATEMITFPYYADEFDSIPSPAKISRGLTDYVIRTGKSLLATPVVFKQLVQSGHVESLGTPSFDWLGVPLKNQQGETFGIMAIQTYNETVRLHAKHQEIMEFVSTQVAMAIERKRSEVALQKSEEKYRSLVENLSDVIFTVNTEGSFIYVSPSIEQYTGFSSKQIIGKSFTRYVFPDDLEGLMASFKRTLLGQLEPYEFRITDKQGMIHHVRTSAQVLKEDDIIVGLTGIMSDISQQKRDKEELIKAKEQAEESNRLKSAFLATMNHELRTPLNHILGFSDLMRSGAVQEKLDDYADVIYKSGQNLLEIIEDIFELALAEQSDIKLRVQTFKCLDLFISNKAVLAEILDISGKKDLIELVFNADKELLLQNITTDRNKINQVLINLFKNAVKFTRSGKIEFGLTNDEAGGLSFYVEDTGIGIPEDKHGIIFEFFRQADDSHTREYGGVGIGLAISKKIAEVMHGSLSVKSQPGKGSRFCFRIPALLSDKGLKTTNEIGKITFPNLLGKTIIIAEDDPLSLELIRKMLWRTGVRLIEAVNGKEAIDLLKNKPDAILMDLNMPVMDGYTATRISKLNRPDIPVIAITAYALSTERNKAMEAGCDSIISKPVDQQILYNELGKYLLAGKAW